MTIIINRTLPSRFRGWLFLAVGVWACTFAGVNGSGGAQAAKEAAGQGVVLKSFPAGRASRLRYQLAFGACAGGQCPVQVRLVGKGGVIDEVSLDWGVTSAKAVELPLDGTLGVGDPLQRPAGLAGWTAGEDDGSVVTFARTVRLSRDVNGLLVHQSAGFEHVKRRHYLFAVQGARIVRLWTGTEGNGPWWSTVAVTDVDKASNQGIVHFSGFSYPKGNDYDRLDVTSLRGRGQGKTVASQPAQGIYAVVFGPFADPAAARRIRNKNWSCVSGFSVLPSGRFGSLAPGAAALAAMTTKRRHAEAALKRTQACLPGLTGRVSEAKSTSKGR